MALRFVIGLVTGVSLTAAGAVGGLLNGGETDEPPVTTTMVSTVYEVSAEPDWLGDGGEGSARFESTVVLPDELEVGDDGVRLRYELASLGQVPFEFLPTPVPAIVPELWRLTTSSGVTAEATTELPRVSANFNDETERPSGTVRFDLGLLIEMDDVAAIEIVGWRAATPVQTRLSFDLSTGSSVGLFDGSTVSVGRILEQRSSTIVGFDVDAPFDPWRQAAVGFGQSSEFRPVGEGWRPSSSTSDNGFHVTWFGDTLPETIEIEMTTLVWLPMPDAAPLVVVAGAST